MSSLVVLAEGSRTTREASSASLRHHRNAVACRASRQRSPRSTRSRPGHSRLGRRPDHVRSPPAEHTAVQRSTFGLPYVLRAETSHDPVVVPDGSVLADFAYFAVTAGAKRGTLLRSDDGEGSLSSPLEWFANPQPEQPVKTLQRLPDQHGSTRTQQRNFDDEAESLQRSGFSLDRATWGRLEALAKRYLVSESEIDRAVDPLG